MKILLYVLLIALSLLAPVQRLDVAKLQPVEAVAVYVKEGEVVLLTDTEDTGRGETAMEALADMKENTIGIIYLDTAEYLLVAPGAEDYADELSSCLKPSIKVGQYNGGNVKDEAKYMDAHDQSGRPGND